MHCNGFVRTTLRKSADKTNSNSKSTKQAPSQHQCTGKHRLTRSFPTLRQPRHVTRTVLRSRICFCVCRGTGVCPPAAPEGFSVAGWKTADDVFRLLDIRDWKRSRSHRDAGGTENRRSHTRQLLKPSDAQDEYESVEGDLISTGTQQEKHFGEMETVQHWKGFDIKTSKVLIKHSSCKFGECIHKRGAYGR